MHMEEMDDIVYKSCMVQSECPLTLEFNARPSTAVVSAAGHASSLAPTPTPWIAYCSQPRDPSKPALQPGAGIYTSPLTVNVDGPVKLVEGVITDVLRVLRMPNAFDATRFKFNVAVYFTSGYARFSIRIWRRTVPEGSNDAYAVEVMRERGDRIVVTRFFEFLSSALRCCGSKSESDAIVEGYERDFNVDMFDWAPRRLPPEVLETLPKPSAEALASGIAAMVSMAGSVYDDVAVNGCASVAKLAAASDNTRESMADSADLIRTLIQVVVNVNGCASVDTRSNAALALAELVLDGPGRGVSNVVDAFTASPESLHALAGLCTDGIVTSDAYSTLCVRTDCVRILACVASAGAFLPVAQSVARALDEATMTYGPLRTAVTKLAMHCSTDCPKD